MGAYNLGSQPNLRKDPTLELIDRPLEIDSLTAVGQGAPQQVPEPSITPDIPASSNRKLEEVKKM